MVSPRQVLNQDALATQMMQWSQDTCELQMGRVEMGCPRLGRKSTRVLGQACVSPLSRLASRPFTWDNSQAPAVGHFPSKG